jgi:hypothetical protein
MGDGGGGQVVFDEAHPARRGRATEVLRSTLDESGRRAPRSCFPMVAGIPGRDDLVSFPSVPMINRPRLSIGKFRAVGNAHVMRKTRNHDDHSQHSTRPLLVSLLQVLPRLSQPHSLRHWLLYLPASLSSFPPYLQTHTLAERRPISETIQTSLSVCDLVSPSTSEDTGVWLLSSEAIATSLFSSTKLHYCHSKVLCEDEGVRACDIAHTEVKQCFEY